MNRNEPIVVVAKERSEAQMRQDLYEHQRELLLKKIEWITKLKKKLKKSYAEGEYATIYGEAAHQRYVEDLHVIKNLCDPTSFTLMKILKDRDV